MNYHLHLRVLTCCFLAGLIHTAAVGQSALERRKKNLQDILRIVDTTYYLKNTYSWRTTAQDSTWIDWLRRTGELPPDFDQMPSNPFLPEPLVLTKNGIDTKGISAMDFRHGTTGTIRF